MNYTNTGGYILNKVIIASTNPVKINAVSNAFRKVFNEITFDYQGINVPSNVSEQPMNSNETLQGAQNRAMNAKKIINDASYYIGIEGGLEILNNEIEVFAWVYIINSASKIGISRTSSFFLPEGLKQLILKGYELGVADDMFFNRHNSKQQNGAIGILTNNIIDRTKYYEEAVILALIPFINPDLYL
jgi:inosine/xanthosine triphosphatase